MLRNISQKGHLAHITVDILQTTMTKYEPEIEINEQRELVFELVDPWAILGLPDDSYLNSTMTGLSYEATSTREL
jgi:hypothetical protein